MDVSWDLSCPCSMPAGPASHPCSLCSYLPDGALELHRGAGQPRLPCPWKLSPELGATQRTWPPHLPRPWKLSPELAPHPDQGSGFPKAPGPWDVSAWRAGPWDHRSTGPGGQPEKSSLPGLREHARGPHASWKQTCKGIYLGLWGAAKGGCRRHFPGGSSCSPLPEHQAWARGIPGGTICASGCESPGHTGEAMVAAVPWSGQMGHFSTRHLK